MIITMISLSTPRPNGGVMGVVEFANALARRGHEVHIVHADLLGAQISGLDELGWADLDDRLVHHFGCRPDEVEVPGSQIVIGFDHRVPHHLGERAILVQAYRILPPETERGMYAEPIPKLCVSRWLRAVALHLGNPAHQTFHLPYGLRHDRYRVTVPIEERPRRVCFLYNGHPLKRARVGVEVIHRLRREDPSIEAVVYGTGPRPPELDPTIEYHRDPDLATLVGDILNGSAIFLTTARLEGFGMAPLEAMACGCALVTTDNGGSWDYAQDGRTAAVVGMEVDDIVPRIRGLLDDHDARVALGRAGVAVAAEHDWDASGQLLEAILERYLADPATYHEPFDDAYDTKLVVLATDAGRPGPVGAAATLSGTSPR